MNGASPAKMVGMSHRSPMPACTHLLLLPESEQAHARDLDDLEADTRDITLGLAAATEARDENLVIVVDKVQATVILSLQ